MVTMRKLGNHGRFANQLFQYAFLRIFCKEYQCPPWIGQYLFGHDDPPVMVKLPRIREEKTYHIKDSKVIGRDNVDIVGYFQYHTSCYRPHQKEFRSLFQPTAEVKAQMQPTLEAMARKGRTWVGLQLRRGDYGTFKRKSARWAFVAPTAWYVAWLKDMWHRLYEPVLYVASDEPWKVLADFKDYSPVVAVSQPQKAPFYTDFYMLSQCDFMLISNSSFGFAASMLNERAEVFFRPRLSRKALIPYLPWHDFTVYTDERY